MENDAFKYILRYFLLFQLLSIPTLVGAQGGSGGAGGVGMDLVYLGIFIFCGFFSCILALIVIFSNVEVELKSDRRLRAGVISAVLLLIFSFSITAIFFSMIEDAPALFWAGVLMFLIFMSLLLLGGRLMYTLSERKKKKHNESLV